MSDEKKKRGGARPGCGRKKQAAPPQKLDARGKDAQNHAQWLIDQLNAIDPEQYWLHGTRSEDKALQPKIEAAEKAWKKLSFEVQGWARLWFEPDDALNTRKYLYDKASGKAMQTVNHLHDKPVEHTHTLTISERFRIALQKGEARVRSIS